MVYPFTGVGRHADEELALAEQEEYNHREGEQHRTGYQPAGSFVRCGGKTAGSRHARDDRGQQDPLGKDPTWDNR